MAAVIRINILATAKRAVGEFRKVTREADKAGKGIKRGLAIGAGVGAAGITAGVAAAGVALKDGVSSAMKYQDAALQVTNALKNTKRAQGLTTASVQEASAALEDLTGAKVDENDATLAQAKFIRAGITDRKGLDRVLKASANVALGTQKDFTSTSVAIAKALANPAKAAGVLTRAGVPLSKSQQDTLKALAKTGDAAKTQAYVLEILEKNFKGAAEAAGKGLSADLGRAEDALDDSKREIAQAFLPTLGQLAREFKDRLPGAIAAVKPVLTTFFNVITNPAFPKVALTIAALVVAFKTLSATLAVVRLATELLTIAKWRENLAFLASPVTWMVIAVVALVAVIVLLATKTRFFQTIWNASWGWVKNTARTTWDWIKRTAANFVRGLKRTWSGITALVTKVREVRDRIIGYFTSFYRWMVALPGKIIDGIINGFRAGWSKVTGWLKSAAEALPDWITKPLGITSPSKVMAKVGQSVGEGLVQGIRSKVGAVRKSMGVVTAAIRKGVGGPDARFTVGEVGNVRVEAEAGAGGNTYNLTVNVAATADPAKAGAAVIDAIEAWERQFGRRRLQPA